MLPAGGILVVDSEPMIVDLLVEILTDEGGEHPHFLVMHPERCFESRVHNTMELPGYDDDHALRQLRASLLCVKEFLRDLLDTYGAVNDVRRLNERIFRFATKNRSGREVFFKHGVDPFEAVLVDARLPELFRTTRYPQMRQIVDDQRRRAARPGVVAPPGA